MLVPIYNSMADISVESANSPRNDTAWSLNNTAKFHIVFHSDRIIFLEPYLQTSKEISWFASTLSDMDKFHKISEAHVNIRDK